MNLFLMTDMEGVCGVVSHDEWVTPAGRYYEQGKELLTMETNAAIEGFYAAVDHQEDRLSIDVIDGHGYGGVNHLLLDERVQYVRGPMPGPYPYRLDADYDVMAWVGQHAKAGTAYAHIAHTGNFRVIDYVINGVSVGEFGIFAMLGTLLGVQPIFGAGDQAFACEASALVRGIETVATCEGIMPGSGDELDAQQYRLRNDGARHLHPAKARKLIQAGAEAALRRYISNPHSFQPVSIAPPFKRRVQYRADGDKAAFTKHNEHDSSLIALLNG